MSAEQIETSTPQVPVTTESHLNDFEHIESLLASVRADANKFYGKGNNSAGTRIRKILLEVKNACHKARKNVQSTIKDRKDNKKATKGSDTTEKKTKVVAPKKKKKEETKEGVVTSVETSGEECGELVCEVAVKSEGLVKSEHKKDKCKKEKSKKSKKSSAPPS